MADGSFSLGFSTTVLPGRDRDGKNHSGTIAGKLNGLMMPTTPSGWRSVYTSTPVETFSEYSPLARCANVAGELDDLEAARDLAQQRRRAPCRARW